MGASIRHFISQQLCSLDEKETMSSSADVMANGHSNNHDHVLRPRPRKPQHSQVSQISRLSSNEGDGLLSAPENGTASGTTSGRSTPVPENAPPSTKSLVSARKQARAEQRRRIFPSTDFTSRVSHFDPASDYRDFHGFFNLFWVGLAVMGITTMLRNVKDTGFPLRVEIWSLFTVKLWHLAIADFVMVASTAISLPLHHLWRASPADGAFTWKKGGVAVQSIYQAFWLAVWIAIPFWLEWPWTAQVFLLLHTMVLLMKMHSWAFYNGHLSETEKRLRSLDDPHSADRGPAYLYPSSDHPNGKPTSPGAIAGHDRAKVTKPSPLADDAATTDGEQSADEIDTLREDLARELTSPLGNVTYPRNLTWSNYLDFLCCPTLCYELEYPRVAAIDWTALISKIVATFGCIFLLTITSEDFILPVLRDASTRLESTRGSAPETFLILAETISWLLFPFMLSFLLVFFVIFEYILGAFAEITYFGDRHFYSDWWNSTDWMEFSREWNVPVYSFLRRHVYSASRPHIGRPFATVITFLISAIGHEIIMACITKKLRGYGFICQMMQLPLIMLQRTRWVRSRRTLNNVFFWCSIILGLSLAYARLSIAIGSLINLLHGAVAGLNSGSVGADSLGGGSVVLLDVQAELDKLVDALSEAGRLVNGEARDEQRGLEQKLDDGLDGAVVLTVSLNLLLELLDNGRLGGDLEGLLGRHVAAHGGVTEGLSLHDTLHVSGPTELAGTDGAGGEAELVTDDDLLDLVAEDVLEGLGEALVLLLLGLASLLLLLGLLELEVLGDVDKLLVLKLLELSHGVLVNGVDEEQDLEALLLEGVKEGRLGDGLDGLASDVVDVLLVLGHASDVVRQGGQLITRLGGVEAEELGQDGAVLGVLVDTELQVLGEGAVELVELLLVLGDLLEELKRLLDDVLLDDLHDLVLLESLTRQVEGKILRVDNTLDEAEPLRDEVGGVIGDEDAADVELDVVLGLLGLEQVEGSTLGDEKDGTELKLTLDGEVLDSQVVLPVVGQGLVEGSILLLLDVLGVAGPDGLLLVELLLLDLGLLDGLGLLLLLLVLILVIDLLDARLLVVTLLLLDLLSLLVGDLLLGLLLDVEVDGVGDELGVLLDDLLDLALVQVLGLLILEVEDDGSTAAKGLTVGVGDDVEGTTGAGLPDVLLVIVVLGDDADLVSDEVGRVETDTELADHGNISTSSQSLHELLGTGAGNCTQVVDKVLEIVSIVSVLGVTYSLGHTNTGITDGKGLGLLVGDDVDAEVLARVKLAGVGQSLVADLVEGIGGVGHQLTEEDLLVRVDGVDDEGEKLRDLSLELESLRHGGGIGVSKGNRDCRKVKLVSC
ncbi:putative sterol O-acyltransferase 2 [Paramyrothecium foliicola]|nr:putative sterol O-acyltransferase 2 [Paramyrothecium foliicola]